MTGKHQAAEPSWRPLAQKLSGLIRHGSTKNKKSPATADQKISTTTFKRHKKESFLESTLEFKRLEVDVNALEGIHLPASWLEKEPRDPNQVRRKQLPLAPSNSTTPIGDFFSNKSVLDFPISTQSGQLDRSSSQRHGNIGTRPFSMVETRNITYSRTSADLTPDCDNQAVGSILDRGRPIEPKRFVTDPFPKTTVSRVEATPQVTNLDFEKLATPRDLPLRVSQHSGVRDNSTTTEQKPSSQARPAKNLDTSNRHSMYAVVTTSLDNVSSTPRTILTPRGSSAVPVDRIQAWQKSIPTSAAVAGLTSGSSLALTSPALPQADTPVRRVSTRGVGNRLAWIKELEEKKSRSTTSDLGVPKRQGGSVSDKRAMFEKQAQSVSPATRLPPVTRSNSTKSRLSWAGLDSTSSANGNVTATPRTSIDTVRSSHRASSVMSYYDDSFREKMESVVGGQAPNKDKENLDSEEKQRVTARFVPVKCESGNENTPAHLPETRAHTTIMGSEQLEMVPQSPQQETGASTTEPDTGDSQISGSPQSEPNKLENGFDFVQADEVAAIVDSDKEGNPASSQSETPSSAIESEKEEKMGTTPQISQSNEALSILDPQKGEEAEAKVKPEFSASELENTGETEVKVEPEFSTPELETKEEAEAKAKTEFSTSELEKPKEELQTSQPDEDTCTTETRKPHEDLQSLQVVSDVPRMTADEGEQKIELTQPETDVDTGEMNSRLTTTTSE